MDCDQILANLHVGSCLTTAEEIAALTERGISAVLNLQSDEDFQTRRIDWPALRTRYLAKTVTHIISGIEPTAKLVPAEAIAAVLRPHGQTTLAGVESTPRTLVFFTLHCDCSAPAERRSLSAAWHFRSTAESSMAKRTAKRTAKKKVARKRAVKKKAASAAPRRTAKKKKKAARPGAACR